MNCSVLPTTSRNSLPIKENPVPSSSRNFWILFINASLSSFSSYCCRIVRKSKLYGSLVISWAKYPCGLVVTVKKWLLLCLDVHINRNQANWVGLSLTNYWLWSSECRTAHFLRFLHTCPWGFGGVPHGVLNEYTLCFIHSCGWNARGWSS